MTAECETVSCGRRFGVTAWRFAAFFAAAAVLVGLVSAIVPDSAWARESHSDLSSAPAAPVVTDGTALSSTKEGKGVSTTVSLSNSSPSIGDKVRVDARVVNSGEDVDNVEVTLQLSNDFRNSGALPATWDEIKALNNSFDYEAFSYAQIHTAEVSADTIFFYTKASALETATQGLTCVVDSGNAVCPTHLSYDPQTNTVRATIPKLPTGASVTISADTHLTMAAQYQKPYEVWAETTAGEGRSSASWSWSTSLTTPDLDLVELIQKYGPYAVFPYPLEDQWRIPAYSDTFLVHWELSDQQHLIAHLKEGYHFPDGATSRDFGTAERYWEILKGMATMQGVLNWWWPSAPIPAPQVNDPCGADNAVWMKPEDDHMLLWEITDQGHLIARLNPATYTIFPDLTTSHDYGVAPDSGVLCADLPDAPPLDDPCGPDNALWVKPEDTASLRWEITADHHLVAHTKEGYVFRDGSTAHDYGLAVDSGLLCADRPDAPAMTDPCGANNAAWVKPEDTATVSWEITADHHLVARTVAGYAFHDGSTVHDYGVPVDSGVLCEVEALAIPMTGGRSADSIYAAGLLLAALAAAGVAMKRRHDTRIRVYTAHH